MDIEDFTNTELYEETQKCIREMQNRNLSFIDIKVNLSEEDLQDLKNEKQFNWCFDGVNVNLFKGEQEDIN